MQPNLFHSQPTGIIIIIIVIVNIIIIIIMISLPHQDQVDNDVDANHVHDQIVILDIKAHIYHSDFVPSTMLSFEVSGHW